MVNTNKPTRLSKIAREFNVGIHTIVEFLHKKGHNVESNPNTKISPELYELLVKEYSSDLTAKQESQKLNLKRFKERKESVSIGDYEAEELEDNPEEEEVPDDEVMVKGYQSQKKEKPDHEPEKAEESTKEEPEDTEIAGKEKDTKEAEKTAEEEKNKSDVKVVGKIDLDELNKKPASQKAEEKSKEDEAAPAAEAEKEEPDVSADKEVEAQPDTDKTEETEKTKTSKEDVKVVGKIDLDTVQKPPKKGKSKEQKAKKEAEKAEKEETKTEAEEEIKQTQSESIAQEETATEKTDTAESSEETIEATDKKEDAGEEKTEEEAPGKTKDENFIPSKFEKLSGPRVVGKIELPSKAKEEDKKKAVKSEAGKERSKEAIKRKKRKRIRKENKPVNINEKEGDKPQEDVKQPSSKKQKDLKKRKRPHHQEISEEEVQKQIKETLSRLTTKGKSKGAKYRKEKRDAISQKEQAEQEKKEQEKNILHVAEFVTVNELSSMMDVPTNDLISTCMNLGLFVSINQRLDAETISLLAEEYGYKVEFVSADLQEDTEELEEEEEENLEPRSPVVTVMGHVDHGKTKLLDHVRKANVIAGEAGGITQHIGAYSVSLDGERQITFLDTPGHEAFTAMRARGAQITDVAIIVVAADDGVMPQTVEAINHAQAAGVPIVFAINKIDKPTANPDKIKEELANMNLLVEDWGGKYQSQEISAKQGMNIEDLLEKVLLEAELLELKANPHKRATGTIIESSLDRGRGYVATILVESGTLKTGDIILAGTCYGHVKAMYNERGISVIEAGPSTPVILLGLNGAPQAGEQFKVFESDREAKEIANKREQLQREQGLRTQKHITLDEIGRRIAIGNFQELNIIVKGDVDGSVEALSDALIKLSTNEIQVNVIHKGVGQISESDVMLAVASNAIIIGFQVRPSMGARRLAEKEEIDIRLYSIIYDATNEIKDAMEGMLSPDIKEEIVGTAEVKETFKISKVGTIAGCQVREGKINRNHQVRVIREGIVVYTGSLGSLKRFKEDVKEVVSGYECGLNIENYNDIKVGDIIEAFQEVEVKKTL